MSLVHLQALRAGHLFALILHATVHRNEELLIIHFEFVLRLSVLYCAYK
jgi:hypothetical protein